MELVPDGDQLPAIPGPSIDIQVATAKRWPRKIKEVVKRLEESALLSPESAASCFYALPRGGKKILGKSIRLAEMAAAAYQNLRVATRIASVVPTGDNPHVVIEGVSIDVENNVAVSLQKRRRIIQKNIYGEGGAVVGKKPVDEDDINLAVASCSATAYRDTVLKVVPSSITDPIYKQARAMAVAEAVRVAGSKEKYLKRFHELGVQDFQILKALGLQKLDDIKGEHLEILIGIGTAISEGMPAEEVFGAFHEGVQVKDIKVAPTPPAPPAPTSDPIAEPPPAPETSKPKRGRPAKAPAEPPKVEPPPQDLPQAPDPVPAPQEAPADQGEPADEPPPTNPKSELEIVIETAGGNFDLFKSIVATNYGRYFPKAETWAGYDDIDGKDYGKLLNVKTTLVSLVKQRLAQP